MQYTIWWLLLGVAIGGAIGGFGNALLGGALVMPTNDTHGAFQLGYLSNIVMGILAGIISLVAVLGVIKDNIGAKELLVYSITGMVAGLGGSRIISDYAAKATLKDAVVTVAQKASSREVASKIAAASSPAEVAAEVDKVQPNKGHETMAAPPEPPVK